MKRIKLWLLLTLSIVVLQGCIHYHYTYETPQYAYDGVDDPYAHDEGAPVTDVRFADASYYPWWSIDYYYLGRHHYRPPYLRNTYQRHRYFSPAYAYSYGIGPHYWPYYAFYSPFYYPYATFAWYDPWYGWPRYGIGTTIIWTSTDPYPRQSARIVAPDPGVQAGLVSSSVSTMPSADANDTGMEIRSRANRKILDSHIGPAPVIAPSRSSRSPRVVTSPAPSQQEPVAPAPGMVRQIQPAPARPVSSAPPPSASPAPVAAQPRLIRQV
ncbi:MAG: hypothetical protein R3212_00145, partial [Xanthomonadales bacterium]|nr:hypothetical protein [Xanthomonadales bacterium]